jgi:hypothetical protein
VTRIQRFGSALNLIIHFHMVFLDGVYLPVEGAAPVFRHVPSPTGTERQALVQQIRRADNLIGHSITDRIALGPRAGQKLFTLQTVHAREPEPEQQGDDRGVANAGEFSLHANLDIQPHQREMLERLCRAGAAATDAPDEVSWGVRAAQAKWR